MYIPMLVVFGAVWISWAVYQIAYTVGFGEAVVETMKLNSSAHIETPAQDSAPWWYFLQPVAVYIYLSFLSVLPSLLDQGSSKGVEK